MEKQLAAWSAGFIFVPPSAAQIRYQRLRKCLNQHL